MSTMIVEFEWDDDLGEDWMNIYNLRACLYGQRQISAHSCEVAVYPMCREVKEEPPSEVAGEEKPFKHFMDKPTIIKCTWCHRCFDNDTTQYVEDQSFERTGLCWPCEHIPEAVSLDKSKRIHEIREMVVADHGADMIPIMGGAGGFGETFCGHIHDVDGGMTFKDLAIHFGITMSELADVTADHIRRL